MSVGQVLVRFLPVEANSRCSAHHSLTFDSPPFGVFIWEAEEQDNPAGCCDFFKCREGRHLCEEYT